MYTTHYTSNLTSYFSLFYLKSKGRTTFLGRSLVAVPKACRHFWSCTLLSASKVSWPLYTFKKFLASVYSRACSGAMRLSLSLPNFFRLHLLSQRMHVSIGLPLHHLGPLVDTCY